MPRPRLRRCLSIVAALFLVALLPACNDTTTDAPTATTSARQPSTTKPQAAGAKKNWLVMLYEDADDEILEEDMLTDLNEAELAGSNAHVTIVAQVDRYDGGYDGEGDWTTTKRFLVKQDNDLTKLHSQELADLGELNMASGATLVDFVTWAAATYPADHYALIMSDHGAGWPGGWNDPAPEVRAAKNVALADSMGNMLFLMQLHDALGQIMAKTTIGKFDVLGFDACLMSTVEVYSAIAPYARYAVASAEVEPTLGWAYAAFLGFLNDHPESDGEALSRSIVSSYIKQDELIIDDAARSRYVKQAYDEESMTAAEVIKAETERTTLASVDLAALPAVMSALDDLVRVLTTVPQKPVAAARRYALAFESVFDEEQPKPAIDLANFAQLLKKKLDNPAVASAVDALQAAIDKAVIAGSFGRKLKATSGISIHFPNSKLYKDVDAGAASYAQVAKTFADSSLWDDFLAFHYTKRALPEAAAVQAAPPAAAEVVSPAAAPIMVAAVTRSAATATQKKPVTLGTTITGANIAFVYVFVGRTDAATGDMQVLDMDFLEADTTREVNGVVYPDWGTGAPIDIEYDWDGTLTAISDGNTSEIALIEPENYGSASEDSSYTITGSFITAKGKKPRRSMLRFSAGKLVNAYGFSGSDASGAMREITPKRGDRFTLNEMTFPANGGAAQRVMSEGATVVFGKDTLTWEFVPAPKGTYQVGFITEDFDGNWYTAATDVKVK